MWIDVMQKGRTREHNSLHLDSQESVSGFQSRVSLLIVCKSR